MSIWFFIFHQFWHQGQSLPGLSSVKSVQYASTGPTAGRHFANRNSSSALVSNATAEAAAFDPFIGKKVWTRWPEDNHFYEAVITDYNPAEVCLGLTNCQNPLLKIQIFVLGLICFQILILRWLFFTVSVLPCSGCRE